MEEKYEKCNHCKYIERRMFTYKGERLCKACLTNAKNATKINLNDMMSGDEMNEILEKTGE